jgi:hypothetical protein
LSKKIEIRLEGFSCTLPPEFTLCILFWSENIILQSDLFGQGELDRFSIQQDAVDTLSTLILSPWCITAFISNCQIGSARRMSPLESTRLREDFYSRTRYHSHLGDVSPDAFERASV